MGSSRTALVVTPSLEAYGSDLQMLQSVAGLLDAGWRVVVAASAPGRLSDRLIQLGATIEELDFPVLRRANASGAGVAGAGDHRSALHATTGQVDPADTAGCAVRQHGDPALVAGGWTAGSRPDGLPRARSGSAGFSGQSAGL